jgi:hypothetical protein
MTTDTQGGAPAAPAPAPAPAAPAAPAPAPAAPPAPPAAPAANTVTSAQDWDAFYAKAGRPEKADGYQFTKPEGLPGYEDGMASWFKDAAYKAGLNTRQAAAMHDAWVGKFADHAKAQEVESANQAKALGDEMAKTWGSAKDEKLAQAKRGAQEFGFDAAMLDRIEATAGSFKMLDAFARIGAALGEDSLHRGSSPGGVANPWAKDTHNLTQQAKIMREDPATAARLMAQAGVKLPD